MNKRWKNAFLQGVIKNISWKGGGGDKICFSYFMTEERWV